MRMSGGWYCGDEMEEGFRAARYRRGCAPVEAVVAGCNGVRNENRRLVTVLYRA